MSHLLPCQIAWKIPTQAILILKDIHAVENDEYGIFWLPKRYESDNRLALLRQRFSALLFQ